VAWQYRVGQPDVDHFNREYQPDAARGGADIVRLDPRDGSMTAITHSDPPVWDFRASASSDGKQIVFCRAAVGESPAIWVAAADGTRPRQITRGIEGRGADHPRWIP
jgi:TolB protein